MKQEATVSQVLDPVPTRKPRCIDCGAKEARYPCLSCGSRIQCSTCKLMIGDGDDSLHCPFCKKPSHRNHFLEWLKIKGNCPNCREPLKAEAFTL